MASFQKLISPTFSNTVLVKSASPTDTPPLVITKSACFCADIKAFSNSASLSGNNPKSITSQ